MRKRLTRDYELLGYELDDGVPVADAETGRQLLGKLLEPAGADYAINHLAKVRLKTKAGAMSQQDLDLQIAAYVEEMARYPADVVRQTCRDAADKFTFWPSWHELREIAEGHVMKRTHILRGLERAIQVLERRHARLG